MISSLEIEGSGTRMAVDQAAYRAAPRSLNEDFKQTQWLEVELAAREDGSDPAREALERLCTRYWPAIYGHLRRRGMGPADAEDLTQGFFAKLLATNAFSRADRGKGRFRNFLLGALHRFLADTQRRNGREKRGQHRVVLAFDFAEVEKDYLAEADPALTPEECFDRRWAATVLDAAFAELKIECLRAGKAARFAEFSRFLSAEGTEAEYAGIAVRLDASPQSITVAVCRFRDRYRALVCRLVLATVSGPEEVTPEFAELFR